MFTGIVEEVGKIKSFSKNSSGAVIEVWCKHVLKNTKIGDSIAVNGCCQTVVSLSPDSFCANVSEETLAVTNFKTLKKDTPVNLERALTLNTRLGGHIVQGHVDCLAQFVSKEQLGEFYNLGFKLPEGMEKYAVHKGSITVNGISLTIAEILGNEFKIAVIPQTFLNTTLNDLKIGDYVNIETDILGKYVEKFLSAQDNKSSISMKFLQENGFL